MDVIELMEYARLHRKVLTFLGERAPDSSAMLPELGMRSSRRPIQKCLVPSVAPTMSANDRFPGTPY